MCACVYTRCARVHCVCVRSRWHTTCCYACYVNLIDFYVQRHFWYRRQKDNLSDFFLGELHNQSNAQNSLTSISHLSLNLLAFFSGFIWLINLFWHKHERVSFTSICLWVSKTGIFIFATKYTWWAHLSFGNKVKRHVRYLDHAILSKKNWILWIRPITQYKNSIRSNNSAFFSLAACFSTLSPITKQKQSRMRRSEREFRSDCNGSIYSSNDSKWALIKPLCTSDTLFWAVHLTHLVKNTCSHSCTAFEYHKCWVGRVIL